MQITELATIKLGPRNYRVSLEEDLRDGSRVLLGLIHFEDHVISIRRDIHPVEQAVALLHELLHGCFVFADIDHEESLIVLLGNLLTGLIRDNPDLIRFIQECDNVADLES